MRRADRLFELIHLLRRARKAITAVQLAEALEVAPRTIYRDIAALMAMRVPIDGAAGVGYIMRPGYFRADRIVACHETGDSFADLAPRLRRDWHARLGRPCQGRDGG